MDVYNGLRLESFPTFRPFVFKSSSPSGTSFVCVYVCVFTPDRDRDVLTVL